MKKIMIGIMLLSVLLIGQLPCASANSVALSDAPVEELAGQIDEILKFYDEELSLAPLTNVGKIEEDSPLECYLSSVGSQGRDAKLIFYCNEAGKVEKITIMHNKDSRTGQKCSANTSLSIMRALGMNGKEIKEIVDSQYQDVSNVWVDIIERRVNFSCLQLKNTIAVQFTAEDE